MEEERRIALMKKGQVSAHLKSQIQPELEKLEQEAFTRLMGEFNAGTLTDLTTRSILGEIKGYRNIIRKFDTDIKRVERNQGEINV